MSVLINGMKMPESCSECGQFRWNNFLQSDVCRIAEAIGDSGRFHSENEGIENRPSWCPLVPIPPHGRLIDADALKIMMPTIGDEYLYAREMIEEAPTIIEAEEEE